MRRRYQHAITPVGTLRTTVTTDLGVQLANSVCAGFGFGALSIGWGVLAGDDPATIMNHAAAWGCVSGGFVLWAKSIIDTVVEYGDQLRTKPEPKPLSYIPESPQLRNARNQMIALLEDSVRILGADATKIPSDDTLGKPWNFRNRSQVLSYFGDRIKVIQSGRDRGTYLLEGTLQSILSDVRAKRLAPLLSPDAST